MRSTPHSGVQPLLEKGESGEVDSEAGSPRSAQPEGHRSFEASPTASEAGVRRASAPSMSPMLPQARRLQRGTTGDIQLNELQYYIYRIVWSYFLITVVLNITFAASVFVLLQYLNVDLAVIISVTSFFLSFIPEIGAICSAVLPIPFILLTPTVYCHTKDTVHDSAEFWRGLDIDCVGDVGLRFHRILASIVGMFLIKLVVSNLLSAFLMGRSKTLAGSFSADDKEVRETHGVIVLFAVVFFGKVWGIVGMLISVPILSIVRLTLNMGSDYHRQKAETAARILRDEQTRERRERRYRADSLKMSFSGML